MAASKGSGIHASLVVLVFPLVILSSCTDNEEVTSGGRQSLSDPSITPTVIFTLPAPTSVGPFNMYNAGDGSARPHFIIQFNKFIDEDALPADVATCVGFDDPVRVVPMRRTTLGKSNTLTDIIAFEINDGGAPQARQVPYGIGRTYQVRIDTTLDDVNGNHLRYPFTFSFTPEPYFRVVGVFPANGSSEVLAAGQSFAPRLTFNSKVSSGITDCIQLSPPLGGRWRIQHPDSNAVFFVLDTLPSYGTSYTMTVAAIAADKYGNQLRGDFRSTFATAFFRVRSTSPVSGHSLSDLRSTVRILFTGPIDPSTVRANLTISSPFPWSPGTYVYGGDSIVLGSSGGWVGNTNYTVVIGSGIRSTNGTSLTAPHVFSFRTAPFAPTNTSPSDGEANVALDRYIVVSLNNDIDPLSLLHCYSIVPNVAGSIYYSGGNTFTFRPSRGLAAGATHAVTIDTTLRARNGSGLSSRYTFSFRTQALRITGTSPANGDTNVMLNQALQVWCNGVLDTGSIRSSFAISPLINGTLSVHYGSTEFWFGATGGWRSGVTYSVTIGPTLRAQAGGTLGSPYNFSFRAIPFKVTQTVPSSGQTNVLRNTMIQVSLSARIDPATVQNAFGMTPNATGSFATISNADYFTFYPSSPLSANTTYTVIVGTSLRSFAGDSLALPYSFPFTTGPY